LIGIFRRAFERPDAQENKTAIRGACGIQNKKKNVRRQNAPDGHCNEGTITISGYNVIVTML